MSDIRHVPIRVLFVCLGNICRSPMAEAVFVRLVERAGLANQIMADSAGTGDYHIGEQPHRGTRDLLRRRGYTYSHAARQVALGDFDEFDYIVALDQSHLAWLRQRARGKATVLLMLDLVPHVKFKDVPDPYFTGNFEEVYGLVEQANRVLLERIVAERGLQPNAAYA